MKDIYVLGIESSCDETSVSVVKNGRDILSNIIASQMDIFADIGGVIPEIASREHIKNISLVYEKALEEAKIKAEDLDAIAVTKGPGLVGSLLVGITAAKTLALKLNKPLIAVDHIAGHIYASYIENEFEFPALVLIASGAHTELVLMTNHYEFQHLGGTVDDAVGEVFDKIARILDLPYPGGPQIEKLAQKGSAIYNYPKAFYKDGTYNFSFSGIKSHVFNFINNNRQKGIEFKKADVAASFQKAAFDIIVDKTVTASDEHKVKNIIVAGGVGANMKLREMLYDAIKSIKNNDVKLLVPSLKLCTDNAAMIAVAGTILYKKKMFTNLDFKVALHSDLNSI